MRYINRSCLLNPASMPYTLKSQVLTVFGVYFFMLQRRLLRTWANTRGMNCTRQQHTGVVLLVADQCCVAITTLPIDQNSHLEGHSGCITKTSVIGGECSIKDQFPRWFSAAADSR